MTSITPLTRQRGAALITCLMLLVVMTLLGVSSMTSSTLEERMAGNVVNKHMSFQAAEAALRAGELVADGLGDDPVDEANGIYEPREPDAEDFPLWTYDGTGSEPAINWQDVTTAGTVVIQNPSYIIEDYTTSPRDADCALEVPIPPGCMLPLFRVTAQGWGLNLNGYTMVQSTYKSL